MEKYPLISAIIPVYKVEKYIHRCIASVMNQTYNNIEIILVDDGSPDECGAICDDYAKKDSRIKVIHKENGGVSSARNLGLTLARGEYIVFVDSDDYIAKDMYEVLINDSINSGADVVFCGYTMVDESENVISTCAPKQEGSKETIQALKQIIGAVDGGLYYGTGPWNKLIKKACISDIRFDERISVSEDALFLVEVIQKCSKIYLDPEPLYFYVQREGSAYHTSGVTKQKIDNLRAWKKIREKLYENDELRKRTEYVLFNDGIQLLSEAYCEGKSDVYKEVYSLVITGKRTWLEDKRIHFISRAKAELLLFIMNNHVSRRIVAKIANMHS